LRDERAADAMADHRNVRSIARFLGYMPEGTYEIILSLVQVKALGLEYTTRRRIIDEQR